MKKENEPRAVKAGPIELRIQKAKRRRLKTRTEGRRESQADRGSIPAAPLGGRLGRFEWG